jgi:hypothetical protein
VALSTVSQRLGDTLKGRFPDQWHLAARGRAGGRLSKETFAVLCKTVDDNEDSSSESEVRESHCKDLTADSSAALRNDKMNGCGVSWLIHY